MPAQKKTFFVFGSAFILQIVALILTGRTFPDGWRAILTDRVTSLLQAHESIFNTFSVSTNSFLWSIMPWLGAGFLGGLASRNPKKGALGAILAVLITLALFIVVYLFLEEVGLSPLLNSLGRTMVIGSLLSAILATVGGIIGGTLTQS